ncbi:aldolase [Corynebacterium sp. SA-MJD20WY100]|uniref:Cgl0159 family (beta/alpha)8-fold protein n=1 Tax=Corynebacterium sp. SA-MJD20WY100 TaxID=3142969 RepID=UPI0032221F0A
MTISTTRFCSTYDEITETRLTNPELIAQLAAQRARRTVHDTDGRMLIVAADHPARGALASGPNATAMADRRVMLDRLREALAVDAVDGVLGTPDVLEDLLLMGALENKIVFASMNRGGLAGSHWEIEDRFTAYDASSIASSRFDGGKMLTRIDLDDDRTSYTLEASAHAVNELADEGLIAMIEPFMSSRVDGKVINDLSTDAVIKSVHIAQGLGRTSAYTWLKLPVAPDMHKVMTSTTLPTLILGGDPGTAGGGELEAQWKQALAEPNVRGLIVGRALLYPSEGTVTDAVTRAAALLR